MKKSIKSNFYGTIIFSVIILFFTGFSDAFGVENNVTIEGDSLPEIYSRELYVVYITPTEQSQKITLTIYGPTGKIAGQTGFIGSGHNHHNFYVKFSPPLYKIDSKYTLEITGTDLIGRKTIVIQDQHENIETKQTIVPKIKTQPKIQVPPPIEKSYNPQCAGSFYEGALNFQLTQDNSIFIHSEHKGDNL